MLKALRPETVNALHRLLFVLRKLRVVGLAKTVIKRSYITESGRPIRYDVVDVLVMDGVWKSPDEELTDVLKRCFSTSF